MKDFDNIPRPDGEKSSDSGKVSENAPQKNVSLFPIDHAITRSTLEELKKRISITTIEDVTEDSLKKMYRKNNTLFNQTIESANRLKEFPHLEDIRFGYIFGAAMGYEILERQALLLDSQVPTVSQEVIDAYNKAGETRSIAKDDLVDKFWDGISRSVEKDPGFSLPLQEAALEIETPDSQAGFLLGALDVYLKVKKAEKYPDISRNDKKSS